MTSPVVFLVNDQRKLERSQTTYALVVKAAAHTPVHGAGAGDLVVDPDGSVSAVAVPYGIDGPQPGHERVPLDGARVWVRLNPARAVKPRRVQMSLEALALAENHGARVRNRPVALWQAGSKLALMSLPPICRPPSFATCRPDAASTWAESVGGPLVLKPLLGTQGKGVVRLEPEGIGAAAAAATKEVAGGVMIQGFLDRAPEGDVRIHVVGGQVLEVGGKRAIVRRIPATGEFRSNVALGGTAAAAAWSDELAEVVHHAGPVLERMGLWHVGLDVVGGKVVEVNAFSPGGLTDAGEFEGVDFVEALVRAFLEGA